jgi:hypothetical protein
MAQFELAQLNIAAMREPLESPAMGDFVANLERINALADAADGFVWRLQDEAGDATALRPFGPTTLVNISVWRDLESLTRYVYQSAHSGMVRRRREWFTPLPESHVVLWWVPRGHRPTEAEAAIKLAQLRTQGPTGAAFTFADAFPPPG